MSHTWTISAGGRVYGPYSAERMQGFVAEGRLAPHSMIARDGAELHTPALSDPQIAPFFQQVAVPEKPADPPVQPLRALAEKPVQTTEPVQSRFGRGESEA